VPIRRAIGRQSCPAFGFAEYQFGVLIFSGNSNCPNDRIALRNSYRGIGLTVFWIGLLLYVRIVKPLFLLRQPYRVTEVRQERGDSVTLVLLPDGHAGFRFKPGQFGWLTLWGSPFQITGHPFSFSSSAAAADGRVEMTIRNLGDFTSGIAKVPPGRRVFLDGPYGAFTAIARPWTCLC
jgi:predicted ferric reductase